MGSEPAAGNPKQEIESESRTIRNVTLNIMKGGIILNTIEIIMAVILFLLITVVTNGVRRIIALLFLGTIILAKVFGAL